MLRFRRDRLFVGLEPRQVTLVRLTGTLRPRLVGAESFQAPDGSSPLLFAQDILKQEVPSKRWRTTHAQVVLADSMVRYFIAPLPTGARNVREVRQAAALRFEEIFGEDTKDWTVNIDQSPLATHHLGCAVRTELVHRIQQACKEAAIVLEGVAPFGVMEFNRHHGPIGNRSGWFAAIGPQTLWTALKSGNGWLTTHVHHLRENTVADLPSLLDRQILRSGIGESPGKQVWVTGHLPDQRSSPWLTDKAVRRLGASSWPDQSEDWCRTFRLALSPVWPACD